MKPFSKMGAENLEQFKTLNNKRTIETVLLHPSRKPRIVKIKGEQIKGDI